MKDGKVGIGIVGAGSIGIRGALDHFSLPDVQDRTFLAAVCDPAPGRAEAAKDKYGVAEAYEKLDDLLQDGDVDMCILCSPIGLHYEQGMAAIAAGKHLHFNKTMTVTSGEATEIIDAAAQKDLKIVSSPGQMLRPTNLRIRKMIENGDLGKIAWASVGAAFGDYHENEGLRTGDSPLTNINPSWYWRKPGGGPMYDMTVYGLHTMTGILGPAKRVTGLSGIGIKEREWQGQKFQSDADDNTLLVLDFGDNVFAFVYGTFAGSNTEFGQPSFFGQKGAILGTKYNGQDLDYPGKADGVSALQLTANVKNTVHAKMGEMHVFEDSMQLVNWIREGVPSPVTAEHARHVIEIIEAGYAAAETGQTQVLQTTFTPPSGI